MNSFSVSSLAWCKGLPSGIHTDFLVYCSPFYLFSLPSSLFLLQKDLRYNCMKNFQYSLYFMTQELSLGSMSHLGDSACCSTSYHHYVSASLFCPPPSIYFSVIYLLLVSLFLPSVFFFSSLWLLFSLTPLNFKGSFLQKLCWGFPTSEPLLF